jgi:hypothetical protein
MHTVDLQVAAEIFAGAVRKKVVAGDDDYTYVGLNRNPNAADADATWRVYRVDETGNTEHPYHAATGERCNAFAFAVSDMEDLIWSQGD